MLKYALLACSNACMHMQTYLYVYSARRYMCRCNGTYLWPQEKMTHHLVWPSFSFRSSTGPASVWNCSQSAVQPSLEMAAVTQAPSTAKHALSSWTAHSCDTCPFYAKLCYTQVDTQCFLSRHYYNNFFHTIYYYKQVFVVKIHSGYSSKKCCVKHIHFIKSLRLERYTL